MNLPLKTARVFAERVTDELGQYCRRIEIAGSIRRGRPTVHDIDLVCLCKDGQARADLRKRALLRASEVVNGAQAFRVVTHAGVQIDIYFAHDGEADLYRPTPPNWGTLLLCRTGSEQHNIKLCLLAQDRGWSWKPHHGLFDAQGHCLAAETEQDIFDALEIPFVPPEQREV